MTGPLGGFETFVLSSDPDAECARVLAVVQWYVDAECDVGTMLAVAEHLDGCCACADEVRSLYWLKAAVRRCNRAPESRPWH